MHAIQTSGNCIRNTTADPYAGATAEEVDDPRVWSEAIRQWSTFHPEFSFLPRKFKIAVTAAPKDRTAAKVARHRPGAAHGPRRRAGLRGDRRRRPWAARPMSARPSREYLPAEHGCCSYLEAILRVYNRHGRRDNIYKARIKILVAALGADEFARQVEAEWAKIKAERADLPDTELARIRGAFAPTGLRGPAGRVRSLRGGQGRRARPCAASCATTSSRTSSPATPSSRSP